MDPLLAFGLLPLMCYVVAATPFGWLAGKLNGIEIREHGSRNIGATNVGRVLGRKWGVGVFALDVLKGTAPVFAAGWWVASQAASSPEGAGVGPGVHGARVLCAVAAILGHVFTFWLGFRGGKGVATALGALLGVWPEFTWPGLSAFGVWVATVAAWRYVSLASIAAAAAFPLLYLAFAGTTAAFGPEWPLTAFSVPAAVLIIVKHRANIGRLLAGTEPKIGAKAATQGGTSGEPGS